MVIQCEEPVATLECMSTDQEVGQKAARARIALLPPPGRIRLECAARGPPNLFIQIELDVHPRVVTELVEEPFGSTGCGHEFSKDRSTEDQRPTKQRIIERFLGRIANGGISVPESNDHIRINGSCHLPRISRIQRLIAFLPEPIPRLPMPRYFANGLLVLTGRTRTPPLSVSNNKASPGRTPRARRTASGTVICPFVVIFACFSKARLQIPYFSTALLTFGVNAGWMRIFRGLQAANHSKWNIFVSDLTRCGMDRFSVVFGAFPVGITAGFS